MPVISRQRWLQLEPLLDQALDLPLDQRVSWMEALRTSMPDLAAELSMLLEGDAIASDRGFLAHPIEVTLAGVEIGAYTLERPLGHGGMGSVWLARRTDGRFEGHAAVKLLNLSLASAEGQRRFRREGSLLARLTHPGIARLLDAGVSAGGQPYLVLEHVDGKPIDEFVKAAGLSVEERVRLILKVLDAVDHAHANLVVHRDLKPSNILVTADGTVKLLDFGIATLLDTSEGADDPSITVGGARAFTPEFAAPEQVRGDVVTAATDVYALGVLLYLLVAERHPTAEGCHSPPEAIRALLDVQPARIGKGDLGIILDKALRKDSSDRYATVASFGADLRRWIRHQPISARPRSLTYRARKFGRRNRAAIVGVSAGMLLLGAYVTTVFVDRERVRRALAEATTNARKAEQVTEFTVGLFEATGEGSALSDTVSARELLRRSVAHAHDLAGQPVIEAQMLDLIGRIRTELGDYDEAHAVLAEALDIRRRELGDKHPDVATSEMNLAAQLMATDAQDGAAVPLLKRAVALRRELFGERDSRTADALYALASATHVSGNYAAARPLFEEWFASIQGAPPQLTPTRAQQLTDYASMLEFSNQFDRAERLTRQALAMNRALYGPRHSRVAIEMSHLGVILSDENREADADTLLVRAVEMLRASYPDGHPALGEALRNYGYHLNNVKRWADAEIVWREVERVFRHTQGTDGLGYANAVVQIGHVQVVRGQYREAEQTLRGAIKLNGARRPPTNPVGMRGRMYLGEALRNQNRLPEAEALLLDSYRHLAIAPKAQQYAAHSLVALYETQGRTQEAARFRALWP